MNRTMLFTCVIHLGSFLCRPLQNNSVKCPTSTLSGEREPQRLVFNFLLNLSLCFVFGFAIVLTVNNEVNDIRVSLDT